MKSNKIYNIKKDDIKELVSECIKRIISETNDFGLNIKGDLTLNDIKSGVPLYHRPSNGEGVLKSLFTYGFSREYTSTNGGNMYGPGVYTVYSLKSSQVSATGYGKIIMKVYLLGGYQDFLIFNSDIAKKVYGTNWHIVNQIKMLLPEPLARKVLDNTHLYMDGLSSRSAYQVAIILGNDINKTNIRGFVFTGGHDGDVCFIRDFSAVIPVEYSEDNGRTWKQGITQELINRAGSTVDTTFKYKNKEKGGEQMFNDVSDRAINGFVMVHKNDKVNFIDIKTDKLISNAWFDFATNFDEDGYAEISLNGETLGLYNDNGEIYITDEDGFPMEKLK